MLQLKTSLIYHYLSAVDVINTPRLFVIAFEINYWTKVLQYLLNVKINIKSGLTFFRLHPFFLAVHLFEMNLRLENNTHEINKAWIEYSKFKCNKVWKKYLTTILNLHWEIIKKLWFCCELTKYFRQQEHWQLLHCFSKYQLLQFHLSDLTAPRLQWTNQNWKHDA